LAETLLVVEDEVLIRLDISSYLRAAGYDVLEAGNAQQAIDMLRARTEIALVFTDVQMPGDLNGLDLASYIQQQHPEVRIIVTSGRIRRSDMPAGLGQMVEKPYGPQNVLSLIRDALGQGA
jgi:CheY-like chemotaxis protein